MIVVRQVRFSEHIDRVTQLIEANWEETGFGFPLCLDVRAYQRFEVLDLLLTIAAFDGDEIVGYSTAMIAPHPYNPSIICCNSDALFVSAPYRNGRTAYLLLMETERMARERGASRILWHTRGDTDFSKTLNRRGYQPADVVMMREL